MPISGANESQTQSAANFRACILLNLEPMPRMFNQAPWRACLLPTSRANAGKCFDRDYRLSFCRLCCKESLQAKRLESWQHAGLLAFGFIALQTRAKRGFLVSWLHRPVKNCGCLVSRLQAFPYLLRISTPWFHGPSDLCNLPTIFLGIHGLSRFAQLI